MKKLKTLNHHLLNWWRFSTVARTSMHWSTHIWRLTDYLFYLFRCCLQASYTGRNSEKLFLIYSFCDTILYIFISSLTLPCQHGVLAYFTIPCTEFVSHPPTTTSLFSILSLLYEMVSTALSEIFYRWDARYWYVGHFSLTFCLWSYYNTELWLSWSWYLSNIDTNDTAHHQ